MESREKSSNLLELLVYLLTDYETAYHLGEDMWSWPGDPGFNGIESGELEKIEVFGQRVLDESLVDCLVSIEFIRNATWIWEDSRLDDVREMRTFESACAELLALALFVEPRLFEKLRNLPKDDEGEYYMATVISRFETRLAPGPSVDALAIWLEELSSFEKFSSFMNDTIQHQESEIASRRKRFEKIKWYREVGVHEEYKQYVKEEAEREKAATQESNAATTKKWWQRLFKKNGN